MALFGEFPDMGAMRERTEKAWLTPMGVASPLWLAFGAAATAGVAYWWMTRWTRPVNVEALAAFTPSPKAAEAVAEAVVEPVAKAVAEAAPAPVAALVEPAPEPFAAAPEPVVAEPKPAKAPKAKAAPAKLAPPDDLTLMNGVGPKLTEALAARGVIHFAQIAAWTADDLAEIDKALSLKGRAVREAWVAQAKRFAKGH